MESSEYRRNQSENNFTTLQKIWYSSDKENKKRRQVEEKILDYRIPEAHDLSKPTSTPRMEPIKSRRRTKQENFLGYRSTARNNNFLPFHKIWYSSEERDKEEKHRQVKEEWLDCQMPEAIEVNSSKRRCLWPSAKESYMPYTSGVQNTQVKWYSSEERDKEGKHRQVKEEWLYCQMPEAIEVNPSKRRCLWPSAKETYMPYTSRVQNTQSSITKADPFSLHYGDIPQPCKENVSIPQEYSTVIKYGASLLSNSSESYRPSHRYSIYDENGYNVRGYYTAGFYPQQ
nr:uncharacterized protein LOC123751322 [Procambarus clarkii]XP_045589371.1 uncharacterized protein LOC123751322 [Procambarus clarkii]XP_045589372.1 uncharacterized protein LOC123751322 [Procambarus clarkii]XP_045589373.1 uncharacterized protein LOC123751322 [Procambarus clarkii]XP_045589374.1 uncharacterized protein LOC123751322 [Procambarus clarkii]XP_045589375.1 uncharacterized protein LOC123751322 [Procambarus clarkii]